MLADVQRLCWQPMRQCADHSLPRQVSSGITSSLSLGDHSHDAVPQPHRSVLPPAAPRLQLIQPAECAGKILSARNAPQRVRQAWQGGARSTAQLEACMQVRALCEPHVTVIPPHNS